MTDRALVRVTPEKLVEIRNLMKTTFNEDATLYDSRDIECFNNEDWYTGGFLQWKEEMKDCVELAKTVLKWRKENDIRGLSPESIGGDCFKNGVLYTTGYAKDGSRLFFINCKLHFSKNREEHKKALWYMLERFQRNEPGKKITFIMDVPGASLSNVDNTFNNILISTFSTHFPGLLSRFIVWDMPWIFNKVWALIKRFLTQEQRDHTMLLTKKDIHEYIDEDNQLVSMGGKNNFVYSYPPFPDDVEK